MCRASCAAAVAAGYWLTSTGFTLVKLSWPTLANFGQSIVWCIVLQLWPVSSRPPRQRIGHHSVTTRPSGGARGEWAPMSRQ